MTTGPGGGSGSGPGGPGGGGPPKLVQIWDAIADVLLVFRTTFWSLRYRWSR